MDLKSLDLVRETRLESILFTPSQLRQILSAYARGVLQKNWKDYAILSESNQTMFAVVERGQGDAPRILFAITVIKQVKKDPIFKVFEGERPVLQSRSFLEALERFGAESSPSKGGGLRSV